MKPVQDFLECVKRFRNGRFSWQKKIFHCFAGLLRAWNSVLSAKKRISDEQDYGVAPPEFAVYLDAPQTDMITCNPKVTYGKKDIQSVRYNRPCTAGSWKRGGRTGVIQR